METLSLQFASVDVAHQNNHIHLRLRLATSVMLIAIDIAHELVSWLDALANACSVSTSLEEREQGIDVDDEGSSRVASNFFVLGRDPRHLESGRVHRTQSSPISRQTRRALNAMAATNTTRRD